ncbi:hypothetical protein CRG98_029867 [Punica granatum]|uniref:Uncharacterized protein n=1 Tax=Punica granatum TaxID=22663 RepID=A0A2I0J0E9_PUNGR|nr:hypothetical protein CRG98_029867 [Punica granatum]
MVESGPNGATTRRLPSWMLAPQADETVNKANEAAHLNDGVCSKARSTRKPKSQVLLNENEKLKDKPGVVAEGGRKRSKKKASPEDAGSDGETREMVAEGKESKRCTKKVRKSAPRGRSRRRIKKENMPVPEDNESSEITCAERGSDDYDLDLTVDDLMSIANEIEAVESLAFRFLQYISADMDLKDQKPSRGESRNEISTTEERSVQVNPVDAIRSDPKPPSSSACLSQSSKETMSSEEAVVPFETTGDPAQDMLNLLLGPLLKKHVDKDEKKDELLTIIGRGHP